MVEKFWKTALAIGGVASTGAFVFYSLNKQWLSLDIFSRLTPNQTFLIMLVFLLFVFLIAVFMLIAWVIDKKRNTPKSNPCIIYSIPDGCSFRQVVSILAAEDKSVIEFRGFRKKELDVKLSSKTIEASSTLRAIELIQSLAKSFFPAYSVIKIDGKYIISKKE